MEDNEKTTRFSLSLPEAARACDVPVNQLYSEINAGRLRLTEIGKRSVLRVAEIERWLAAQERPGIKTRAA